MFRKIASLILLAIILASMFVLAFVVRAAKAESTTDEPSTQGPRMDNLLIKYYNGNDALYAALKTGDVDLTDMELRGSMADDAFDDPNIQTAISPSSSIFGFDFNNNATIPAHPNYTSPTEYKGFRQGIACLINKTQIVNDICNYSFRIDTPYARPCYDWWVDWSICQYDSQGNLLGNYPYEYNSTLAASYFDQGGFVEGTTINPYYDDGFPGSVNHLRVHPETGEDLDPLIFYIRNDSSTSSFYERGRLQAGRNLGDNLRKLGIPVDAIEADYSTCVHEVMEERNYHIYTMGWSITPRESLSIYTSWAIANVNYPQFRNATYDNLAVKSLSSLDLTASREAALECQKILVDQAVCVWVWSRSTIKAYRNVHGVVNARGQELMDNRWTFLTSQLGENASGTTIDYGLSSQPHSLNIVTDYSRCPQCFDRIYDTLLSFNPYDKLPDLGEVMPWMANDWRVEEWESPYNPSENLTKLTFYLRDGIKWHDGVELNSTDVKFTIEYLRGLGSLVDNPLESIVSVIHHVIAPNKQTVVVYENVSDRWTLYDIGVLPILPKHILQGISNVTGYTPGADEGRPANETLIGSGPWKYVFYNASMLWLEANRDYFMETPPTAEVDFRYDWEMGCWAVDGMDATMLGEAYGTRGDLVPPAKWEPGCDIAKGDCKVNAFDAAILAQEFNMTWGKSAKHFIIAPPIPPTDTAIYIEPPATPVLVGQNFTVYVRMDNFTSLSGLQFKLTYDNSKLEFLDMNVSQVFGTNTFEAKNEVNQTKSLIWVSITSLDQTQLNDNATVAAIAFNATKPGGSTLDLWNTKLACYGVLGSTSQPMPHQALDRGVVVGVTTPTGTNVVVEPAEDAQVTFASTTSTGITTLDIIQPPSPEFTSVVCCDIKTTASYSGDVNVQFSYDPAGMTLEDEQAMKIWLWNESSSVWVDITTSVDTDINVVYGQAPHLSIFGVTKDISIEGEVTGQISAGFPKTPPLPPQGLRILNYYELTCSSSTGPLTLRLAYDDNAVPEELEVFNRIWVWDDFSKVWSDITTFVDVRTNSIFGVTQHLSIFGVTGIPPSGGVVIHHSTLSRTIVGKEYTLTIDFTVQNQLDFTQSSVEITLCSNSTVLRTYTVALGPGAEASLSFTWETGDWAKGEYAVSALGIIVGWALVTIPGDVDGNHHVNIFDIVRMASVYGVKKPDPKYDSICDIDGDGDIDIFDIVVAAGKYGDSW